MAKVVFYEPMEKEKLILGGVLIVILVVGGFLLTRSFFTKSKTSQSGSEMNPTPSSSANNPFYPSVTPLPTNVQNNQAVQYYVYPTSTQTSSSSQSSSQNGSSSTSQSQSQNLPNGMAQNQNQ